MKVYTIYKVTNITNGKIYIGFTSNYQKRVNRHIYNSKHREQHFYNAIRKYGAQNFIFEPIYETLDGYHCKEVMEPFFIGEYDSFNHGYNSTKGGEGSEGYKHTDNARLKLSLVDKHGTKNPFYNKKHKMKSVEINRQKNIELMTEKKGKTIGQYSIDGRLIQVHKSIRSAARSINKTHPSILNCCKGLLEHAHGFVWRYI